MATQSPINDSQTLNAPPSPSDPGSHLPASSANNNVEENIKQLYLFLEEKMGWSKDEIERRVKGHPEAHTVEQWLPHASHLFPNGVLCKNLFLRDKKKLSLWHIVAEVNTKVDMKKLTKDLGFNSGTLRFAPDEDLIRTMGVEPGSVTPMALYREESREVNVIIDSKLFNPKNGGGDETLLLFHPMKNTLTLSISIKEFREFLSKTPHSKYEVKDLE